MMQQSDSQNASMERTSSYSTGGGSGANSDSEALNGSLQTTTRLEIRSQASAPNAVPYLMRPSMKIHENCVFY